MNLRYSNISTLITACIWLFTACNKPEAPDCFKSAGRYTTEVRTLDEFSRMEIWDYMRIELVDSAAVFAEITAPANLLPDIETNVTDGSLRIANNNRCNWVRSFAKHITVRIYSPDFFDIQNHGTGDITSVGTLRSSHLKIENRHAAGTITLQIQMDSIAVYSHTGVSDKVIAGTAARASYFEQGLGYTDARRLVAEQVFVNNSSVNDVLVCATDYLYTHIAFGGNVYYTGEPNHIDKDIKGSGQLLKIE